MEANVNTYSPLSKLFHWVIAFAVIGMLSVGFFLDEVPKIYEDTVYMMHMSIGLTILGLMIIRLVWVHFSRRPALPSTMKTWEKGLAKTVQYGFYVLLIAMPFSGWIMVVSGGHLPNYFGLFDVSLPGVVENKPFSKFMAEIHEFIAWTLIVFIVLHVVGALKHYFIDKDRVLQSMLPGKK